MWRKVVSFSFDHPKFVLGIVSAMALVSLFFYPRVKVDTDPENMLRKDEFVRVFHHKVKKEFALYDFIVLGIVNNDNEKGVFNVETLNKIYEITERIKKIDGVIAREIIAPSTKDNIRQGGIGTVVFEWLMHSKISTQKQADTLREEIMDNPMFYGTMVSEDGKALCIYVPIKAKNLSYKISKQIKKIISEYKGNEKYYITGLPVAEDTFGFEMFKQMAISAPLAAIIIFLLMLYFFKSIQLIIAPLIMAIIAVIITMGLLILFGFPVHIMSSMIPIFLMPISVLDSIHILSEFFDKYKHLNDKKAAVMSIMDELFTPLLYTSLTSAVGFFSLSFSPIPPVQAFGVFVAFGIMLAWVLTITFIPAYIAILTDKSIAKFAVNKGDVKTILGNFLAFTGRIATQRAKEIIVLFILLAIVSIYGIMNIKVNDNPVKWFAKNHPIRIADTVLNEHFGGTYTAYLVMRAKDEKGEVFKEPKMLRYIESLQEYLKDKGVVGKSTSIVDVVKKVYYELLGGDKKYFVVPKTKPAVAQCLMSYESSHKPDDLWHFVSPNYESTVIWIQLRSGDNQDMERVLRQVDEFISKNPPPYKINYNWAGLTYINVVWQNKMVVGMLKNFLGSYVIVLFMMLFLFKSVVRALISMIPLTITILFIYGLLGWVGKDYDMPVAVLSALTLGLSIDFAIHFIQRSFSIYKEKKTWQLTSIEMFGSPAKAIYRNAIVIAVGFLPLLFAPLVPYRTVGFFMFAIMACSAVITLLLLPAVITIIPNRVFEEAPKDLICKFSNCAIIGLLVAGAVLYLLRGYVFSDWQRPMFISIGVGFLFIMGCPVVKRGSVCAAEERGT